jgi:hypothetical protein
MLNVAEPFLLRMSVPGESKLELEGKVEGSF